MCRCSVAQKTLFRDIPVCFTDCFWDSVADHLLQFSHCVDVASLLWYHWKKVCSTTPMSSSEQNLWMEFQLWLGLCQLEGRLPQKPQDPLLTKPLKVRFCNGACSDIFELVICTSAPLLCKLSQCDQINMYSMAYDANLVSITCICNLIWFRKSSWKNLISTLDLGVQKCVLPGFFWQYYFYPGWQPLTPRKPFDLQMLRYC